MQRLWRGVVPARLHLFDRNRHSSPATTANQWQDITNGKLDKKKKGRFGPPSGRKRLIFWPHSPFSTQAQVLDRPHPACCWHAPRARPAAQAGIACILPGAGTRPAPLLVRWDSAARTDCADGRFGERLRRFLRRCGYSKPTTLCGNAGLPSSGSCQREVRTPRGRSNADMYHLNFCVRAI